MAQEEYGDCAEEAQAEVEDDDAPVRQCLSAKIPVEKFAENIHTISLLCEGLWQGVIRGFLFFLQGGGFTAVVIGLGA